MGNGIVKKTITVGDLIAALEQFPKDREVWVHSEPKGNYCTFFSGISDMEEDVYGMGLVNGEIVIISCSEE